MTKYVYVVEDYDRWDYYQCNIDKVFYKKELADAFKEELGEYAVVVKCELVGIDSDETSTR